MGRRRELDAEFLNVVESPGGDRRPQAGPAPPAGEADPARPQPRGPATCERCGSSSEVMLVTYLRGDLEVTAHLCVLCKARRLKRVRLDEQPKKEARPAKVSLPGRRRTKR